MSNLISVRLPQPGRELVLEVSTMSNRALSFAGGYQEVSGLTRIAAFWAQFCMNRSRGGTPYIISRAAEGVLGLTCAICDSAILWSLCNFIFAQDWDAVLDQTMAP
jgi:hypothetical protein